MAIIQRCILAGQWQHTLYTYSQSFCSFPPAFSSPQDIEYCLGAMKPCYRNQFHGGCLAPALGGKPWIRRQATTVFSCKHHLDIQLQPRFGPCQYASVCSLLSARCLHISTVCLGVEHWIVQSVTCTRYTRPLRSERCSSCSQSLATTATLQVSRYEQCKATGRGKSLGR